MSVRVVGRLSHWACGMVVLWAPLVGILLASAAIPTLPKEKPANTTIVFCDCFYMNIDSFVIQIGSSHVTSQTLNNLDHGVIKTHAWGYCSDRTKDSITVTRYYGVKNGSEDGEYNITMTFEQDPSSPNDEWYMSGFKYRNLSIPVIFQYSGVEHAVTASGDMAYRCANNLTFMGESRDLEIKSKLTLKDLYVQAFGLKGCRPSSTYHDCGENSKNNLLINLVIGLVVGGTVLLALIVIAVTLVVKKVRSRGYNLLDS